MKQESLDKLLKKHEIQIVGNGYSELILSRETYRAAISELMENGWNPSAISWWEFCAEEKTPLHGIGTVKSIYKKGCFSELPLAFELVENITYKELIELIENKVIRIGNELISFEYYNWLTPGFCLNVPINSRKPHF